MKTYKCTTSKTVVEKPDDFHCDVCKEEVGSVMFDARTVNGQWAWMCIDCFCEQGVGLGIGKGQKYMEIK